MKIAKRFIRQGSVLDIGCGEGKLLNYIEKGMPYLGLDCDADCIKKAEGIWKDRKEVEFRTLLLDDTLNLNRKFDNIVLLAVIEHLVNPGKSLNILKNYLKENGRMIITTPGPVAEKILYVGSRVRLFDREAQQGHKNIFNKKDFYKLAARASLKVDDYLTFELGLNHIVVMIHG